MFATAYLTPGHDRARPQTPLKPVGLVLHSTATPEATARNERDFFERSTGASQVSVHIVVDWIEALVVVPINEVAYHVGPNGNRNFIGMELCESADPAKFQAAFARWIEAARTLFDLFAWPVDDQHLWSHQRVSQVFKGTDHQDPIPY